VKRWRYVIMPLRQTVGPWRDTDKEAKQDAVEAGLARRDEHEPERIYLDELVEIEGERDA
jgi:hypothetical protein